MVASAIVFIVSVSVFLVVATITRGITVEGQASDASKQIRAAALLMDKWSWPSSMHQHESLKARMKDAGVLLLALMQRLLGDRRGFYPVVMTCNAANSISAILVFLVAQAYWTTPIALWVFVLYLASFWPYQTILQGGYHGVAQMFFLGSVYFLQQADAGVGGDNFLWLLLSGTMFGLMNFSSASARKFIPLWFGAFVFSQRSVLSPLVPGTTDWQHADHYVTLLIVGVLVPLILALGIVHFCYDRVITAIYRGKSPAWLRPLIRGQGKHPVEHYLMKRGKVLRTLAAWALLGAGYVGTVMFLSRSPALCVAHAAALAGMLLVILLFTLPNVLANVKGYFIYWRIAHTAAHFPLYVDCFRRLGIPPPKDSRGSGLMWHPHFFCRFIPFHGTLYILSFLILMFLRGLSRAPAGTWVADSVVLGLSILPVLWGELTRGPLCGRAHFPSFVGVLLWIGYATFQIWQMAPPQVKVVVLVVYALLTLAGVIWNVRVFRTDVLPARMATAYLMKILESLPIRTLYTYDTPYNDGLIDALQPDIGQKYQIRYIRSLSEVREGYVFVPSTSAKSLMVESEAFAIKNGDFRADPLLDELIVSGRIGRYAVASFMTVGASRMWVQDSEVTSYRDLILHEITDEDRWRGMAWLLDAEKLHAALSADSTRKSSCQTALNQPAVFGIV